MYIPSNFLLRIYRVKRSDGWILNVLKVICLEIKHSNYIGILKNLSKHIDREYKKYYTKNSNQTKHIGIVGIDVEILK